MRVKVLSIVVAAAWLFVPTIASACDMKIGYLFMNMPTAPWTIGGGAQIQPGSDGDDTYWIANVDATFALGERAIVQPAVGYCTTTGDDDFGELVYGGAFGFHLFDNSDGTMAVNLQAAVTHVSYEGESEQSIPISAQALFEASESASLFGGAGLRGGRNSFPGSDMDWDPFVDAGVHFGGNIQIQVGALLLFGDDSDGGTSTDFGINLSASVPMGG
jgi:hypothetical protein